MQADQLEPSLFVSRDLCLNKRCTYAFCRITMSWSRRAASQLIVYTTGTFFHGMLTVPYKYHVP
jgi:hypothetical protein